MKRIFAKRTRASRPVRSEQDRPHAAKFSTRHLKRIVASLLFLVWPLAFATQVFGTTGASPNPRLKPLTLPGPRWVSDIEYLLNQNSSDDRATDTAEKKPAAHPVHVRDYATKRGSHVKVQSRQSRGAGKTTKKGRN